MKNKRLCMHFKTFTYIWETPKLVKREVTKCKICKKSLKEIEV